MQIKANVEVNIDVQGETVCLVCRHPSAAELSGLLRGRYQAKGRKVKDRLYETRRDFIDRILIDCRNATFANAKHESVALDASTVLTDEDKTLWSGILGERVEIWKDLIPLNWKSSAAMTFEDQMPSDEGDGQGN
jgi:hypothetical protein